MVRVSIKRPVIEVIHKTQKMVALEAGKAKSKEEKIKLRIINKHLAKAKNLLLLLRAMEN